MTPVDGARALDFEGLSAGLDFQRSVVASKLTGLTRDESVLHTMRSGTTLLGIVGHLAWVEVEWFQCCLAGRDVELPEDTEASVDASFTVAVGDTPESALAFYETVCTESRRIAAAAGPGAVTKAPHAYFGLCSVEWVLFHMVRETARHAGHMDILRELTDGAVGYS